MGKKKKLAKISLFVGLAILLMVVIVTYVVMKQDPSCCGSSEDNDSSFVPIFAGVWVPIFVAAANKDRDKLEDKQKKVLTIISVLLGVLLLSGIVTLFLYVI